VIPDSHTDAALLFLNGRQAVPFRDGINLMAHCQVLLQVLGPESFGFVDHDWF